MNKIPSERYFRLVKELIGLQRELAVAFEATIKIEPPSFDEGLKSLLAINPERTVSEILIHRGHGVPILPMPVWVKPRVGVMRYKGHSWLFIAHGSDQVDFVRLPLGLDESILSELRIGKTLSLKGVKDTGPVLQIRYVRNFGVENVSSWSIYMSANAVDLEMAKLSQEEHERQLNELVEMRLLERVSDPHDAYFVLITTKE